VRSEGWSMRWSDKIVDFETHFMQQIIKHAHVVSFCLVCRTDGFIDFLMKVRSIKFAQELDD
jgi:hypothetical protein